MQTFAALQKIGKEGSNQTSTAPVPKVGCADGVDGSCINRRRNAP